jgi:hypothetical protein
MAMLAASIDAINRELEEEPNEPARIRRLKKWVGLLQRVLSEAAEKIGADGFSISVNVPMSVGIGLEWQVKPARGSFRSTRLRA